MLSQKDSEVLLSLVLHEPVHRKSNFIKRIELLAAETDKALFVKKPKTNARKIIEFMDYLFALGSRYVQIILWDHYFKKLKRLGCKLVYTINVHRNNKQDFEVGILKIYHCSVFKAQENNTTPITIKEK